MMSCKKAYGTQPADYLENEKKSYLNQECTFSRWLGAGAEALGLEGEVQDKDFRQVLLGMHPSEPDTALCANPGEERVSSYAMVFSPHKSLTLLHTFGTDEDRRNIEEAISKATERIAERIPEVFHARRGKGGHIKESPAGIVVAEHAHQYARPTKGADPDPQLHRHLTLMTACLRQDGTWGTADGKPLLKAMKALGIEGQEVLAEEMRSRGYKIELERKGKVVSARLAGITDEQCQAFSKRSHEIKSALGDKAETASPKEREVKALSTRQKKQKFDPERLREGWLKTAQTGGLLETIRTLERRPAEKTPPREERKTQPETPQEGSDPLREAKLPPLPDEVRKSAALRPLRTAVKNNAETKSILEAALLAKPERGTPKAHALSDLGKWPDDGPAKPPSSSPLPELAQKVVSGGKLTIVSGEKSPELSAALRAAVNHYESQGFKPVVTTFTPAASVLFEREKQHTVYSVFLAEQPPEWKRGSIYGPDITQLIPEWLRPDVRTLIPKHLTPNIAEIVPEKFRPDIGQLVPYWLRPDITELFRSKPQPVKQPPAIRVAKAMKLERESVLIVDRCESLSDKELSLFCKSARDQGARVVLLGNEDNARSPFAALADRFKSLVVRPKPTSDQPAIQSPSLSAGQGAPSLAPAPAAQAKSPEPDKEVSSPTPSRSQQPKRKR